METATIHTNKGPNCDLSRYRTGEEPQAGDMVYFHGETVGFYHGRNLDRRNYMVRGFASFSTVGEIMLCGFDGAFYPARFDLLHRKPVEVTPNPPEVEGAAFNTADGNGHAQGCVAQGAPAAAITGPGKYHEEEGMGGRGDCLADVLTTNGEFWFGFDSAGDAAAWNARGVRVKFCGVHYCDSGIWNLVRPYVEPPKPVLIITEKKRIEIGGNQFVIAEAHSRFGGPKRFDGVYVSDCLDAAGYFNTDDKIVVVGEGCWPLLCHASNWSTVLEIVAAANASASVR